MILVVSTYRRTEEIGESPVCSAGSEERRRERRRRRERERGAEELRHEHSGWWPDRNDDDGETHGGRQKPRCKTPA
jgi:hypothetical protein